MLLHRTGRRGPPHRNINYLEASKNIRIGMQNPVDHLYSDRCYIRSRAFSDLITEMHNHSHSSESDSRDSVVNRLNEILSKWPDFSRLREFKQQMQELNRFLAADFQD
jgi:hypothetical protein